ncbi:MAG: hypothetical protein KBT46_08585, partial [Ruminococcus sp.]|nr:hypothetical protein [Candidatus Copronaster equi]
MDKYTGVYSHIENCGGVPALFVNDKPFTSAAYMTYLEKYNEYDDFSKADYSFFSVPVLFSGRWISITQGLTPFKKGIFDIKGSPDFSLVDEAVEKILKACPNAYIIPRVNISMPEWWVNENPDDVNITADNAPLRESLYSEKWRTDAEKMFRQFIRYVNGTEYVSHIIGYHIADGNTEEWFHFDMNAGFCKNAEVGFEKFLKQYYPQIPFKGLPDFSLLKKKRRFINDEYLSCFLEYASYAVADDITYFAAVAKEETGNNLVVGAFYGYSLEVTSSMHGTHALKVLLNDKNIDFICSPNSYIGIRKQDIDWTEMYPAASVRLHGKMCFQECDIRTHLTKILGERAPEIDPNKVMSAEIWHGLDTKEDSRIMIKKSFSRQFIKGNGLWWFDMWGGWYADDDIMNDMKKYRDAYEQSLNCSDRSSKAEIAVFIDENAYKYLTESSYKNSIYTQRRELGYMGTDYDFYDISDFNAVSEKYKAVIFLSLAKTEYFKSALSVCKNNNIPYLMSAPQKTNFSVAELKAFCKKNGVHI